MALAAGQRGDGCDADGSITNAISSGASVPPAEESQETREAAGDEEQVDAMGEAEVEEVPTVSVMRAELVRGHRPVILSQVPVYIGLRDRDGRFFEDKGQCPNLRYCWMRGPVIKPCVFHPHKTSQFRDVTKTWQYYCSKECFLRGWWNLPDNLWGSRPTDGELEEETDDKWVKVAETREYSPKAEDIDRPLRLDIIPTLDDGRDASTGGMSLTTGTVIPTPNEARTRRMISRGGSFNSEFLNQQFKVMNWNVLADIYASESVYPYCEKWALSWTWRKHLILKELKSMAADIITLQEVQKDTFDDWFKPELIKVGYEGIFQEKKRAAIFHRGSYTMEGCATFWKPTRFKKSEKHVIDYDKLMEKSFHAVVGHGAERSQQRASKGNIALAVVLEDLNIKGGKACGLGGGPLLCVVNTHILADPGFTDVKLAQCHHLLQHLSSTSSGLKGIPSLICGDFNSTPDSAVYEYIRRGVLRSDHEELTSDPCGLLSSIHFGHDLQLSTAYEACSGTEAAYTNYTEDFKGTLDYIFFSTDSLAVLAISQVDEESQLKQETALPSSTRPSDHVSLVATFMFRPEVAQDPVPAATRIAQSNPYAHHPGASSPLLAGPLAGHMGHTTAMHGLGYHSAHHSLMVDGSPAHTPGEAGLRYPPLSSGYYDAWGRPPEM